MARPAINEPRALQHYTTLLEHGAWLEMVSTKGVKVYRIIWLLSEGVSRSEAQTKDECRLLIQTLDLRRVGLPDGTARFVARPGKP